MAKFNFEKNLEHQSIAVKSTVDAFFGLEIKNPQGTEKQYINPEIDGKAMQFFRNIERIEKYNALDSKFKRDSNLIDISMETGTGKTYVYTKTIFELNKEYGIFKFIIIVPTLSIKAGTINFLNSESAREHFKEQYGKTLKLHIVESKKGGKNKKSHFPPAVSSFVNAGSFEKNKIQVMVINAGMINSKTMDEIFDTSFFDKYATPFNAISSVKPFVIIDEPHKFSQGNKTWENIQKMSPQFILRYGATFTENENLVYSLTAVDSFNKNLVKGINGYIPEFDAGKNATVKFINSDGKEAVFELFEKGEKIDKKKKFKISVKDSFEKIHLEMSDLFVEKLNKNTVLLSNGIEMKKGDSINPYSYSETFQEMMIKKAVKEHFRKEKDFLTREVKIKPLTLFFIDNIDEYRNKDGNIRKIAEKYIKAEVKSLLKDKNILDNLFYKNYLEETLKDISKTHGGYFSKDNSEKDETIEKEINEILHDKQAMLDLKNTRRFIFSKWTLREGWDNPNVFQICKLRSSGSEISKLQEVGRGLRLPVNEHGNRVKDEQFFLNYFVDFTESDFIDSLVKEINRKSGAISTEDNPKKLTDEMIEKICKEYGFKKLELQMKLNNQGVIDEDLNFLKGGFNYVKENYPLIFKAVSSGKIKKAGKESKKIKIRTENYSELKSLWEKLNEKVILEYKIKNEEKFKEILVDFLNKEKGNFSIGGAKSKKQIIEIKDNEAISKSVSSFENEYITEISTMNYSNFLKNLSKELNINLKTIHKSFIKSKIEINNFLSIGTIRTIKKKFNDYLMLNAIDKFKISYQKVSNEIHPTKFTDKKGNILKEISSSDIGVNSYSGNIADNYFLEGLFADSELEAENIRKQIDEVIIFTKIPKNSIKIPIAGGGTYSPDFAYVVKSIGGEKILNFVIETKNVDGDESLRKEEENKIKHAEEFFKNNDITIRFKKQFSRNKIIDLINEINKNQE